MQLFDCLFGLEDLMSNAVINKKRERKENGLKKASFHFSPKVMRLVTAADQLCYFLTCVSN